MVINIELPDETISALIERAKGEGRPASDLAAEAIIERFGVSADLTDFPLEADAVEGVKRGLADIDSGRTMPLDTAYSEFETAFTARFGSVAA